LTNLNPSCRNKNSLIVFDLDHTLVNVNISYAFGKYLYQIGVLSFPALLKTVFAYAQHKVFGKSLHWLHHRSLNAFLGGLHKPFLAKHAGRFCDLYLPSLLHIPCLHYLEEAKKSQKAVALLSSSPDFLVEPIANRLGIPSWIGTCYAANSEGRLSSISCVVDGTFKAEYLNRLMASYGVGKEDICVLSDSILDLPLFEMAGLKVGVNPDRKLRAHCKKHGWSVLED
jgi:phosphoserine phosphatase